MSMYEYNRQVEVAVTPFGRHPLGDALRDIGGVSVLSLFRLGVGSDEKTIDQWFDTIAPADALVVVGGGSDVARHVAIAEAEGTPVYVAEGTALPPGVSSILSFPAEVLVTELNLMRQGLDHQSKFNMRPAI